MYIPKNRCVIQKAVGTNVYGQQQPGATFKERCAIVAIITSDKKTSVRSDSSASRGNAHELLYDAVILVGPRTKAAMHDIMTVNGYKLEIMTVQPRYDIDGNLDHYQLDLQIWTKS